uniref:Olfactory receptor family 5 subfamily K member 4 n=1 Tax=Nomascus leucogenys TaxID=61853 RepID=G1QNT3_NOMLE
MAKENHSLAAEFILIGFTNYPELKTLLFVVFSATYLVTMVGNLGLVALIYVKRHLHTPMYIFLAPMWWNSSLYECMAQFYFLCLAETTDCLLLAAMAYDRYVAICHPLQYNTVMSKTLCIRMTTGAFIAGNLHSMIHVGLLLRLTFCRSNKIDHFFCDILPLYRLSCTDPSINELMIYIFSIPIQIFTIATVLISYLCILLTVFKMKSKEGRGKAFSTCASHFLSVSIFYICLLMYIRPFEEGDKDIPVAIFYTIVIPLLNPFIYSLRNKEVINVLKKIMRNYNILKQTCPITN